MLYERVIQELAEMRAITARTSAREDKTGSISSLEKREFEQRMGLGNLAYGSKSLTSTSFPVTLRRWLNKV